MHRGMRPLMKRFPISCIATRCRTSRNLYQQVSSSGISSNVGKTIASKHAAAPVSEPTPNQSSSGFFKFFKYALIGSVTGLIAFTGYASYAYNLEEVDEKVKELRQKVDSANAADSVAIDNYQSLIYRGAMSVPIKLLEVYSDLRRQVEDQLKGFTEPTSEKLLPDLHPQEQHVFTLVLDLSDTIIYSDWKRERGWRTFKRPGVDDFLRHLAKFYEIIVYSDQLNMYVDPVVDRLDPNHYIRYRLSRGATKYQEGKHFRDLSKLNRDPAKIIYVSASALESTLQPENSVPIKPFKIEDKDEPTFDTALLDLIPFLEYVARNSPPDIRKVLASYNREDIAKEFLERSKEHQRRMHDQRRVWRR